MSKTLKFKELADLIGVHRSTLYLMIKDGRFNVEPIPKTKPRRWNIDKINQWLNSAPESEK